MTFRDRHDAGRRLATELALTGYTDVVVAALPRGGVPIGYEVARALDAPLDVLVVHKLGHPVQPELGLGALGEGGVRVLNDALIVRSGVCPAELQVVSRAAEIELRRCSEHYRRGRPAIPIAGRTVVLVDDGLATGSTARAAIEVARRGGVARVLLAVPVAPASAVIELRREVDDVICLQTSAGFGSVGSFYDDFDQVSDGEVARLLERATRWRTEATPSAPAAG